MSDTGPPVKLAVTDGIAEIRFNRPERLNALSVEVAEGFGDAVDRALSDRSVRAIVVSSEGRAFVAGGDLQHLLSAADRRAAARELIDPMHAALRRLADAEAITIASLRGAVAGAGMSLALGLDLAVAADDVSFNLAYCRVAASPDCGGSWALPRLVGLRKALEIALLCETVDAEEALRLGLVNRVVPGAELEARTREIAGRLASGPTTAFGRTKALLRAAAGRSLGDQLDAERQAFGDCAAHPDFAEAVSAFFARRKPDFDRS